jgi:hypothetical protein
MIRVNGKTYYGNSITIVNGNVKIDGKLVDTEDAKQISIEVNGNVEKLSVDACEFVSVKGNAGAISTISGDVRCGNVSGSVSSVSGDVSCGRVGGSVSTVSGDVARKLF